MDLKTLDFTLSDGIAQICLNRADSPVNAMNGAMIHDLLDVSARCAADDIRAVVISAKGDVFCGGGDLEELGAGADDSDGHVTKLARMLHASIAGFSHIDAPVIIAVQGFAGGAGLSLVAAGDFVVASEEAKFVSAYTAAGLTPDGSATYYLAKHVGLMRAKELFLTNRVLSAAEAKKWGLVSRVVPASDVASEAMGLAKTFSKGATGAFGQVKRLLGNSYSNGLETQMEDEARSIGKALRTADAKQRIAAFFDRET